MRLVPLVSARVGLTLAATALTLGALPGAAQAANPFSELDSTRARTHPGVVLFDISMKGACPGEEEGWRFPEAQQRVLGDDDVIAHRLWRESDAGLIRAVLGEDAYQAKAMRVAWRAGKELDRTCGCMSAPALVGWIDGLEAGKTLVDQRREALGPFDEGDLDVAAELELAEMHVCASRYEAARAQLLALWDAIPERKPSFGYVRATRVAVDLARLGKRDPGTQQALVDLRDSLGADKETDREALGDWVVLNRLLGDDDATLAWYRAKAADPSNAPLVEGHTPLVVEILSGREAYAEAGRAVLADPEGWIDLHRGQPEAREKLARSYALLRVADRDKDAKSLYDAFAARGFDLVGPCDLLSASVARGVAGKDQKKIAKACADAGVTAAWEGALP